MRRTAGVAMTLTVLFASATIADAIRGGGHNPPTRKLESAFKVALLERVQSEDGCYPRPAPLAAAIRHDARLEADVAAGFGSIDQANVVYVIRRNARCGRVRLALRADAGIYVLNSARGPVYVKGRSRERDREERAGDRGPLRAVTVRADTAVLTRANEKRRITIRCPRGRFPLGGGMVAAPPPASDGEGIYPHSYERLGAQRGFHTTAVLVDPSPESTTPHEVTIQVVCGLGLVPTDSPHRTVFTRPGETKSAVARCPRRSYLFSGGFQRTNFTTPSTTAGGNFVTESRAIGPRSWRVTGHAIGEDGGELTAIAHCVRTRRPPLDEVAAWTPVPAGEAATATTPPCPPGRRLTSGGFSLNGSVHAFIAAGWINADGSWSTTGFGYLGAASAGLSAYGYCLRVR